MSEEKLHTFKGRNVPEAMKKVVAKLGNDVFIVEKRRIKDGGLGGLLGGGEFVEIVASKEEPDTIREKPKTGNLLAKTYGECKTNSDSQSFLKELNDFAQKPAPELSVKSPAINTGDIKGAMSEVMNDVIMKNMREEIMKIVAMQARGNAPAVDEVLMQTYHELLENDVAADIAKDLVEKLQHEFGHHTEYTPDTIKNALCTSISNTIDTNGPIKLKENGPTIIVIVGPTGVGKTTTIVKLAFDFVVRENKKVAFITEDMRRPGAEAQLRSLAQLLTLRLEMADTPESVKQTIDNLQNMDLILIDTGGRSPRDTEGMDALAEYIKAVNADEVHLVLSSEYSEKNAFEAVAGFKKTGFDNIVFSKLDETASYGLILNVASKVNENLSYITMGQDYATAIEVGDTKRIARLVAGVDDRDSLVNSK